MTHDIMPWRRKKGGLSSPRGEQSPFVELHQRVKKFLTVELSHAASRGALRPTVCRFAAPEFLWKLNKDAFLPAPRRGASSDCFVMTKERLHISIQLNGDLLLTIG
jgi:hypothetical protein